MGISLLLLVIIGIVSLVYGIVTGDPNIITLGALITGVFFACNIVYFIVAYDKKQKQKDYLSADEIRKRLTINPRKTKKRIKKALEKDFDANDGGDSF